MPRRQKLHHYIYKTTCQMTGKFYVGMHSTDALDDGYLGSGKILGYSIAKHGRENHKKEILEHLPTREALKLREKEIVNEELLADPLNINLKYGGEGGWEHITSEQKIAGGKIAGKITGATNMLLASTPSAIAKRVETFKAKGLDFSGARNGQYGTVWVIRDAKPVKIKKEVLGKYLQQGYRQGRK